MKQELINRLNRAGLQVRFLTPQQEKALSILHAHNGNTILRTSIMQYFRDCAVGNEQAPSMKIADLDTWTGKQYLSGLSGEDLPESLELCLTADDMRRIHAASFAGSDSVGAERAGNGKQPLMAEHEIIGVLNTVLYPHSVETLADDDGSRIYRFTRGQGTASATIADLKMDPKGFLAVKGFSLSSVKQQQGLRKHIPSLFRPVATERRYLSAPHMFYSNAEYAVQRIQQEKATPAQWLAMIQKNGGIKAGEDKWLGLSDWLKQSEAKSLTKDEVLKYIDSNRIELHDEDFEELEQADEWKELTREFRSNIDEVYEYYREADMELEEFYRQMQNKYQEEDEWDDDYKNRLDDEEFEREKELLDNRDKYDTNCYAAEEIAFNMMVDKYGEAFDQAFGYDGDCLQIASETQSAKFISVNDINATRRECVTEGLDKYREIALWTTNAEKWNENDSIHFGSVGRGRCIGWIRFGEITVKENVAPEELNRRMAAMPGPDQWNFFDGKQFVAGFDLYYPPGMDFRSLSAYISKSKDGLCYTYHPLKGPGIICTSLKEAVNLYNSIHVNRTEDKKVLVIDEIQSNRHQEGRKLGYRMTKDEEQAFIAEYNEVIKERNQFQQTMREKYNSDMFSLYMSDDERDELIAYEDKVRKKGECMMEAGQRIPVAPFEKNWHELCMKRMLQYAAENGFDRVAWTKGEQQVKRYNLARVVQEIGRDKDYGEDKYITITYNHSDKTGFYVKPDGRIYDSVLGWDGKHVDELFGKELAKKVLQMPEGQTMNTDGLTIGKDGMMKFYDRILPTFVNSYGKKWGVQVGEQSLTDLSKANDYITTPLTMHAIDVTPAMKQSVMQGQPMFRIDEKGRLFGYTQDDTIYLTEDGLDTETLVHEYTHVWARAMKNGNPQAWQSAKDLLCKTVLWQDVCQDPNYEEIQMDEDAVASEVLARISGKEGARVMEDAARRTAKRDRERGIHTSAAEILDSLKEVVAQMWRWVGKHMFDIDRFKSVDEIRNRVLYDLLDAQVLEHGKVLHAAGPDNSLLNRMTHVRALRGLNGETYIRCKIDGQQQMGKPIKAEDLPILDNPKGLKGLAARYFHEELIMSAEKRWMGLGR